MHPQLRERFLQLINSFYFNPDENDEKFKDKKYTGPLKNLPKS